MIQMDGWMDGMDINQPRKGEVSKEESLSLVRGVRRPYSDK